MAVKVAKWYDDYEMDGIDLDLEEGAGARKEAGPNMIHFIKKLRQLQPNMIISQPTYGYPQVQAEIDVINAGFSPEGVHNHLIDAIGLMVYEGTQALNYVKNYVNGAGQWQGFPMKCRAPANTILLGAKGSTTSTHLVKLAEESVKNDYLGKNRSFKMFFFFLPNIKYDYSWYLIFRQESWFGTLRSRMVSTTPPTGMPRPWPTLSPDTKKLSLF